MKRTFSRIWLVALLFIAAGDVMAVVFRKEIALIVINAKGGCYPWSPREVEYHDGMTLCPGQSARTRIEIKVKSERDI